MLFSGRSKPYDALAVAIQRARDFGIPSYTTARTRLGLSSVASFDALDTNTVTRELLRSAYSNTISKLDALVGALAELHSSPVGVGPMLKASFAAQLQRSRDADKFWFEKTYALDASTLKVLQEVTLGQIIARQTKLPNVFPQNVMYTMTPGAYAAKKAVIDAQVAAAAAAAAATLPQQATTVTGNGTVVSAQSWVKLNDKYYISWRLATDTTKMEISLKVNTLGWVSFGIGSLMVNSDFFIGSVSSLGVASGGDYAWKLHGSPPTDLSMGGVNNVEVVSGKEENGWTYLTYRRPIAATDAYDNPIPMTGPADIVFAFSPTNSDSVGYHGSNRYPGNQLDFRLSPSSADAYIPGSSKSSFRYVLMYNLHSIFIQTGRKAGYIVHAVGMGVLWGVIMPASIAIVRFAKHAHAWLKFHRASTYLVVSSTIPLAATAFSFKDGVFGALHHVVGLILTILSMIALISGYILSWYMSSERGPSEQTSFAMWLSLCKHSHSFIGYGVQALGFWQIKLGLDVWGVTPKDQIDPSACLCACMCVCVCAVCVCIKRWWWFVIYTYFVLLCWQIRLVLALGRNVDWFLLDDRIVLDAKGASPACFVVVW